MSHHYKLLQLISTETFSKKANDLNYQTRHLIILLGLIQRAFVSCDMTQSRGFPGGSVVKEPTCQCRRCFLGQEDPLEEDMATHSSILAWRIPGTEEPGGLQSIVSQRVGHD